MGKIWLLLSAYDEQRCGEVEGRDAAFLEKQAAPLVDVLLPSKQFFLANYQPLFPLIIGRVHPSNYLSDGLQTQPIQ
jgi:hypothetical protein